MSWIRTPVSLKVPARMAAIFWVVKLLTTAFGESTSDYLVHNVNPYLAVVGADRVHPRRADRRLRRLPHHQRQ
jgi:uncharacterized membrane-anchored protein